jgi:dTDP-glucose pyrophosphorylase
MKTTLLILAAGMGSRFGGIKQIEPVGGNGEMIIDYSVFDAIRAGFDKVVFIIRRDIEKDFCSRFFNRIKNFIDAEYVFQEIPTWRTKPLGTTQAVLAAKKHIDGPFCVINADDFYGADAYNKIIDFFNSTNPNGGKLRSGMIGYKLRNTLPNSGTVNRGVVYVDDDNFVTAIHEIKGVERYKSFAEKHNITEKPTNDSVGYAFEGSFIEFPPDTNVSLTFFGFTPEIFPLLEEKFNEFLLLSFGSDTGECILAETVGELIKDGKITLKMIESRENWLGMTYQKDKSALKAAMDKLVYRGIYPSPLWYK